MYLLGLNCRYFLLSLKSQSSIFSCGIFPNTFPSNGTFYYSNGVNVSNFTSFRSLTILALSFLSGIYGGSIEGIFHPLYLSEASQLPPHYHGFPLFLHVVLTPSPSPWVSYLAGASSTTILLSSSLGNF